MLNKAIKAQFLTLTLLIIINYIMDIFFLPTLPLVAQTFGASKYDVQLSIPIILFATAISYMFSGFYSDVIGSKKILIFIMGLFFVGLLTSALSSNIFVFLFGMCLQGLSAYNALLYKYVEYNVETSTVKFMATLGVIGIIALPISTTLAGHVTDALSWRYVFGGLACVVLVVFMLTCFLPESRREKHSSLSFRDTITNMRFILKQKIFLKHLSTFSAISASGYVFFTLSPFIFIHDFHFTARYFGLLLFIPFSGQLLGMILTVVLNHYVSHKAIILIGQGFALMGLVLFLSVFYIYPSAYVIMVCVGIYMIGQPLVKTTLRAKVVTINAALAGTTAAFFAVMANIINGVSGSIGARQDGEMMALYMLVILLLGFTLSIIIDKWPSKEKSS